jgi:hypothetical protein
MSCRAVPCSAVQCSAVQSSQLQQYCAVARLGEVLWLASATVTTTATTTATTTTMDDRSGENMQIDLTEPPSVAVDHSSTLGYFDYRADLHIYNCALVRRYYSPHANSPDQTPFAISHLHVNGEGLRRHPLPQ